MQNSTFLFPFDHFTFGGVMESISMVGNCGGYEFACEEGMEPTYATAAATGADLRASQDVVILAGQTVLIPTGVRILRACAAWGMSDDRFETFIELQVRPKSGRSAAGLQAQFGTIDVDYQGEIQVIMHNATGGIVRIPKGEKVAQLVAGLAVRLDLKTYKRERGTGGFGSTGAT